MKEEEIWNRILLCLEVGDIVRFKNGKVNWEVFAISNFNGKQQIKLRRLRNSKFGWRRYYIYKWITQGSSAYYKLRIVKPHESP